MKSNFIKIAVIGDPNKGKTSFVSNMAYDDSLKISSKSGETTKKSKHPLIINNEIIYELYDTPGFDNDEEIIDYITLKGSSLDIRSLLREFIHEKRSDNDFSKDIEILEVLVECDIIVYVADSSLEYSDSLTSGLEIMKRLNLPSFLVFNNKSKSNKSIKGWKTIEEKYFLSSLEYNVLESSFNNKLELFNSFLKEIVDNKIAIKLKEAIQTLEKDFDNRLKYSFDELVLSSGKIRDYSLEYNVKVLDKYAKELLHKKKKDDFFKNIKEIEDNFFLSIDRRWGFNSIDKNIEEFKKLSLEEDSYSKIFGISKRKLVLLGIVGGGGVGVAVDAFLPIFGLGTLVGMIGGAAVSTASVLMGITILNKKTYSFGAETTTTLSLKTPSNFLIISKMYYYIEEISKKPHANKDKLDFKVKENLSETLFSDDAIKNINKYISYNNNDNNNKELSEILFNNYKDKK